MTGANDLVALIDERIAEWMRVRGPRGVTTATVTDGGDVKPDENETAIPASDVPAPSSISLTAGDRLLLGWTDRPGHRRKPVVIANLTAAGGGGVSDHGDLTGLDDDDHPQYATDAALTSHESDTSTHGVVQVAGVADISSAVATHGGDADAHHAREHAIGGSDHTGTLAHSALASVGANDHHNQAHDINGADHTGTPLTLAKGGTSKALTAAAGGVVYTDGDSMEVLAAGSSGQVLQSGGSSAPSWVTTLANAVQDAITRLGTVVSGVWNAGSVTSSGVIKSTSASGGVGYATGAGGAVAQGTSKSTTVALNAICGVITTHNATLNGGANVTFTLINSAIAATDVVVVSKGTAGNGNAYRISVVHTQAGSCNINIANFTGSNLGEAIAINFAVIKAVNS